MTGKIKSGYAGKEFMINFLFSMVVFSFIFSLQAIFQIIEFLVKGTFHPVLVMGIFFITLTSALVYILPLTFLYASTALFSRLAADRELLVLACTGISPYKLVRTLMSYAFFGALFLLLFNLFLLPELSYKNRDMIYRIRFRNPLSLLHERNIVSDIPGITVYVEKIYPDYVLKNISITYRDDGRTHFLKAASGSAGYDGAGNNLVFNLKNGFMIISDTAQAISRLNFKEYRFVFPFPAGFSGVRMRKRLSDMRMSALLAAGGIRERIEIQKRIVFSVMPLVFVMLGTGIGIRLKQQSKMLHIGLGGGITLLFLQFVLLGEMFSMKSGTPIYMWLPVVLFVIMGEIFLKPK